MRSSPGLRPLLAVAAVGLALSACTSAPAPADLSEESTTAPPAGADPAPPCPNPHGGACLGDLEPGTYATTEFEPAFEYTVPAGWHNAEDLPGNVHLHRQEDPQSGALGGSYVGVYQDVDAAAIDCAEQAQEGIGSTPEELVAWYRSVPGLVVSDPVEVTVGGLDGLQVDLGLEPGVATCTWDDLSGIPLFIGNGVSQVHHVIVPEIDVLLLVLGWEDGNVMVEVTNVTDQVSTDDYRSAVEPLLDSLRFGSAPHQVTGPSTPRTPV